MAGVRPEAVEGLFWPLELDNILNARSSGPKASRGTQAGVIHRCAPLKSSLLCPIAQAPCMLRRTLSYLDRRSRLAQQQQQRCGAAAAAAAACRQPCIVRRC